MARKVAANLNTIGAHCYALLCPTVGFVKRVWGSVEFEERLPKASGCFISVAEAKAGLENLIVIAKAECDAQKKELESDRKKHKRYDGDDYFLERAEKNLKQARASVIVRIDISLEKVES